MKKGILDVTNIFLRISNSDSIPKFLHIIIILIHQYLFSLYNFLLFLLDIYNQYNSLLISEAEDNCENIILLKGLKLTMIFNPFKIFSFPILFLVLFPPLEL